MSRLSFSLRRPVLTLVAGALVLSGLAVLSPPPATAHYDLTTSTVTIPAQTGTNVFEAAPGSTVLAGYTFDPDDASSTIVDNAQAVLSIACKSGRTPTQSSIVVPIGHQEYPNTADAWIPVDSTSAGSTYQGSFVLGDYCAGGTIVVGRTMGPFTADIYSDSSKYVKFRWHYGPVGSAGPWSATRSVSAEGLGGYGADLEVTKVDNADPIRPGENLSYTITVTNNSRTVTASGVVLNDLLDSTTDYISLTGSGASSCSRGSLLGATFLTCAFGNLAPQATRTLVLSVSTPSSATFDAYTAAGAHDGGNGYLCPTSDLCNRAAVTSNTRDPETTNNTVYQPTNVVRSGIALDKTVTDSGDADTIGSLGERLTYSFKVTNTGVLPLSNVRISDTMLGLTNAACVTTLAAGASTTCPQLPAQAYTVAASDIARGSITNTASTSGTPSSGSAVVASDTETISTPATPGLALAKTVTDSNDADTIGSRGETLTYSFRVTNTGNVPLTDVTLTDSMLGLTNATCAATLAVGASTTCQGGKTWTVTSADIGRGQVSNAASVRGTTPAGGTTEGTGTATIPTEAAAPAVVLTKSVRDSNDADQIGSLGETLTYGFTVTNTGNVPLTNVTISDPKLGLTDVACATALEAGGTATCPQQPTYVVTASDIGDGSVANTATATAATAGGRTVQDPDTVTISTPAAPAIAMTKRVADSGDAGSVANEDETLTYTFTVTNTGNVPLSGVTITDAKLGLDKAACVSTLAVGARATCPTATYTTDSDDIEDGTVVNTASAQATSPAGTDVSASETARIATEAARRALTIVKTVKDSGDGDGIGSLGERLTYSVRVTNTGNVRLVDLTITDAMLGLTNADCAAKLAPRASTTCPQLPDNKMRYTVTAADIATGSVANTARAKGSTAKGGNASGQDTATIATPAVPAVALTKTVTDGPDADEVGSLGETLTYGFTVTNAGNVPLTDITLSDPALGVSGFACAASLPVGASATCTPSSRTHTVTSADVESGSVTNTAAASATAPGGSDVTDDDRATIATESPLTGVILDKTVTDTDDADSTGALGESLRYAFTVTNTGNVALRNVTITDSMLGMAAVPCVTELAAGATTTCAAGRTHTVSAADIDAGSVTNDATVSGTPATGPAVTDDDSASIDTPATPSIEIDKSVADSGDPDSVGSLGEALTYTFRVTNSGNQPLRNVTVTDAMLGLDGAACVPTLAIGESATCLAGRTHTVTAADLGRGTVDNTASASGVSSNGRTVRAQDSATFPTEAPMPAVALDKTATDSDDAGTTARAGETLRYSFRVTNNGNLPLRDVTITDAMLGIDGAACVANLAVGASATCLDGRTYVVKTGDVARGSVDNTATARALPAAGGAVTGQDTASVPTEVSAPAVTLTKTVRDSNDADVLASQGETLSYDFSVVNNGNVPLTDVTVTDSMLGMNGAACAATLAPGASTTCPQLPATRTHVVTEADLGRGSVVNTATVSAKADGATVTDQAAASIATPSIEPEEPTDPGEPFNWDWRYNAPTCDALTVTYPRDLPSGQSNDVNIRFQSNVGQFTLNFHNNEAFWSGTTSFVYRTHPQWPAGITSYTVEWVQVAGTNYHWEDEVRCNVDSSGAVTQTKSVTTISGWRGGSTTLNTPATPASDTVDVNGFGYQSLELEELTDDGWRWAKTIPLSPAGMAQVIFPRLKQKGTYQFRLRIQESADVTGATTEPFVIRMR